MKSVLVALAVIATWFAVWLVVGFIAWDWDVAKWTREGRLMLVMVSSVPSAYVGSTVKGALK